MTDAIRPYRIEVPEADLADLNRPKEIFRASRRWVEKRYTNLVYWNELARGGHFAAFEQPEAFVRELCACFRLMR